MSWQKLLAQGFASSSELLQYLHLPQNLGSMQAEGQFKTRVPRGFAARMRPKDPHDPLLLQVLAAKEELLEIDHYIADPLTESQYNPKSGLLHKYYGRVLVTLTGVCAVNCRYCFRRHFPYQENNPGRKGWWDLFEYIKNNNSIHEVILSGGDPLLASDTILEAFFLQLKAISHVKTIRFHSRIPIVLPERINDAFITVLADLPWHKVVIVHCNHAQEINDDVRAVWQKLRNIGCHLLNQSVLLKGVNDTVEALTMLSTTLFQGGVLPYYLHLLDKVAGASHFDIPLPDALALHQKMQMLLPGYLVPRLVREEPGKQHKILIHG